MVLPACAAVDELPAHVGRCGDPVDVDHVVFPLDATSRLMAVTAGVAALLVGRVVWGVGGFVAVVFTGLVDELRRHELHPALGQRSGESLTTSGMHRAGVGGGNGNQLHAAVRASALVGGDDFGVHRAGVGEGDGDG